MMCQQLAEKLKRCVQVGVSETQEGTAAFLVASAAHVATALGYASASASSASASASSATESAASATASASSASASESSATESAASAALAQTVLADPGVCEIRLSLHASDPAPAFDIAGATRLYVHRYGGGFLSLFDVAADAWIKARIATGLSLDLSALPADANFDVFGYNAGSAEAPDAHVQAVQWLNDCVRSIDVAPSAEGVLVKSGKRIVDGYGGFSSTVYYSFTSGGTSRGGQAIALGAAATLKGVRFLLWKTGSPTGAMTASLYACSGSPGSTGVPTGAALATSAPIDASAVSAGPSWMEFEFSAPYAAAAGNYCVVLSYDNASAIHYVNFGANAGNHAGNAFYYIGGSYTAQPTNDAMFQLLASTGDASAPGYRMLGTFRTTSTAGQCEDSAATRFVWNAQNRVVRPLKKTDSATSWAASGNGSSWVYGPWNSTANRVRFVLGLRDEVALLFSALVQYGGASSGNVGLGIGLDSTSSNAALTPSSSASSTLSSAPVANYRDTPLEGYHYLQLLQMPNTSAAYSTTFYGTYGVWSMGGAAGEIRM